MTKNLKNFAKSEFGGAVVDWVVITAAVVTLAITVTLAVSGGTNSVAAKVNTSMDSVSPGPQGG